MESLGSNFQAYLNVIRLLLKISDCGAIVKLRAQKITEARRVGTFGKLSVKAPRRSKRGRRPTVPCRSFSGGGANQMTFDIFDKPPAKKGIPCDRSVLNVPCSPSKVLLSKARIITEI